MLEEMKLVNGHLQQLREEDKLKIAALVSDLDNKNSVCKGLGGRGRRWGDGHTSTRKCHVFLLFVCIENSVSPAVAGQTVSREREAVKICESSRMHGVLMDVHWCMSQGNLSLISLPTLHIHSKRSLLSQWLSVVDLKGRPPPICLLSAQPVSEDKGKSLGVLFLPHWKATVRLELPLVERLPLVHRGWTGQIRCGLSNGEHNY